MKNLILAITTAASLFATSSFAAPAVPPGMCAGDDPVTCLAYAGLLGIAAFGQPDQGDRQCKSVNIEYTVIWGPDYFEAKTGQDRHELLTCALMTEDGQGIKEEWVIGDLDIQNNNGYGKTFAPVQLEKYIQKTGATEAPIDLKK